MAHLWGIFHGYVSHNQMVIILDVWTNNMTMIPPMYGKTDEEPVFWGSFSDTHNLDQGEGEADDPAIGWRMLKVKSGNPLDLGLTLVSCRFSLKNGVLQNGIQFGRGKKLFIFKAISLKSTSCYVRWTNRIDSWNYDPRTPRLNLWLVVWICFLTFDNIWTVILPIDELIFFTGVGSTTNRCQSFFSLNLEIAHQNLWRDPMKSSYHGAQAGDVAFKAGVGSPGDFGIGDDSRWLRNLLRILLWKTVWWFGYPIKSPFISNQSLLINSITGWWFGTWILFSPRVGMMIQSDSYFSGG